MENFSTEAKEIYLEALRFVNRKEQEARVTGKLTFGRLYDIAAAIVRSIENSEQLTSYAVYYFDPVDITRSHVVNTAIFAAVLAKGIGYSDDQLVQLCAMGLLHDIGVARLDVSLFNKPVANLTEEELAAVETHSRLGYEIILQADDKHEEFAKVVYQHHEKCNGSGYPVHLTRDKMMPNSKILSLIDTYEALIHPRDHRDALIPPVGIQELIKQEGQRFSNKLMKALIETISLYPVGCFVHLNTGEIATVVKTNKHFPSRPQVRIMYDKYRQKAKRQIVDLAQNNLLVIEKCIPSPKMQRIA